MKTNPTETMTIKELLESGDKQAIIEWFRKKEKQENNTFNTTPTPSNNTKEIYTNTQKPAANTIPNNSEQAAQGKWYEHAKCCCSQIIAQMRITDWLLLAIALLLFFQLIKKK